MIATDDHLTKEEISNHMKSTNEEDLIDNIFANSEELLFDDDMLNSSKTHDTDEIKDDLILQTDKSFDGLIDSEEISTMESDDKNIMLSMMYENLRKR